MNKIPVFDAHCDTAFLMLRKGEELLENKLHVDLKRAMEYSPYAQFFAIFSTGENLRPKYDAMMGNLMVQLEKNKDRIALCTDAAQAETAFSQGKAAAFLLVEGAELLDCSEARLEEAYETGVRAVTITWNRENALAGSCRENPEKGLTPLGRDFVRRCQALDVLVDVSHLSEAAFWDIIKIAKKPILASHSNSRAMFDHPRNLTDDQFRAIAETGGAVGINLLTDFLGENANLDTAIAHIEHFLDLGGENTVALGSDFDGGDVLPCGITGIESYKALYEALLARNYPESLLHKIFFQNLMDILQGKE